MSEALKPQAVFPAQDSWDHGQGRAAHRPPAPHHISADVLPRTLAPEAQPNTQGLSPRPNDSTKPASITGIACPVPSHRPSFESRLHHLLMAQPRADTAL